LRPTGAPEASKAKRTKGNSLTAGSEGRGREERFNGAKAGRGGGDTSEGAMLQAPDGLLEASTMHMETVPRVTTVRASPKKQKKLRSVSPSKVETVATDGGEATTQVNSDIIVGSPRSPSTVQKSKLLVLNVYGTLLDCSLLQDPNPNTTIRLTMMTESKRVLCRPRMAQFLTRCFQNFEVAFWGSKSTRYMDRGRGNREKLVRERGAGSGERGAGSGERGAGISSPNFLEF
jgi:hypothetical protein